MDTGSLYVYIVYVHIQVYNRQDGTLLPTQNRVWSILRFSQSHFEGKKSLNYTLLLI